MERSWRPDPVRGGQGGRGDAEVEATEEAGALLPEADQDEGGAQVAEEQEESEEDLKVWNR